MSADILAQTGAHPLGPLQNPGRVGGLMDVFRRRYLLKLLVRKELRVRYQGSSLGLAWSYVKPGVRFVMYFYVIGLLLTHNLPDRPLHIFSGMIMVSFFTDALTSGSRSVVKNKSLVRKINLPREMFPVASILVSAYHLIPMYVIVLVGALLSGWNPDPYAFVAAAMALVLVLVWGLATALLLSAWNVYFRDVSNVVDVIQTVITWTVPMIYPFDIVMDKLQGTHEFVYQLYLASPLANAVLLNNRAFWTPASPTPEKAITEYLPAHLFERGVVMIAIGLLVLWFAQTVFSRLEGRFAEKL
ncbi:MAG: ABC transporter permease [Nocardioidaceae bacterium]